MPVAITFLIFLSLDLLPVEIGEALHDVASCALPSEISLHRSRQDGAGRRALDALGALRLAGLAEAHHRRRGPARAVRRGRRSAWQQRGAVQCTGLDQGKIGSAAARAGLDPALVTAIVSHESGFDPNASNTNPNGTTDTGLMQINSGSTRYTADQLRDPDTNIKEGIRILLEDLKREHGDVHRALRDYAGAGPIAEQHATEMQKIYDALRTAADQSTVKVVIQNETGASVNTTSQQAARQ